MDLTLIPVIVIIIYMLSSIQDWPNTSAA